MKTNLAILVALQFCAISWAATRVAIVSPDASAEAGKVLDLAIAEFKGSKDITVLERAQIDRVLREQELPLGNGIADAERAVKAGRVLLVDLFVVLEGGGPQQLFGVVVFDAQTGVRYADSAVTASNVVSAARGIRKAIQEAADKGRHRADSLRTVGLLSVRNADLPRSFDSVCDTVGLLLERELVNAPGVAVLERRRLEQINRERAVAATAGDALLTSLRTVDLEIAREGAGLRATATLTSFDGEPKSQTTAKVLTTDAAALSRSLARAIAELLKTPASPAGMDRVAEGQRFGHESKLRAQHRDYAAALRAMEAAYALNPADTNFQFQLVRLLPDTGIEILDPGGQRWSRDLPRQPTDDEVAAAVALGHRGAQLLQEFSLQAAATTKPGEPIPLLAKPDGQLCRLLEKLAQVRNSPHRAEMESLARDERFNRIEIVEPFLRNRVHDRESFNRLSYDEFWFALNSHFGVFDQAQWCRDSALVAQRWVEVAQRFNPPDSSGNYYPLKHLISLFGATTVTQHSKLFGPLWSTCAKSADPVLRAYGKVGPAMPALRSAKVSAEERLTEVHSLRLWLQEEIEHQPPSTNSARRGLFDILDEVLSCVRNDKEGWKEYREASWFALSQRAGRQGLFNVSLSGISPAGRGGPAEARKLATGILRLIETDPDVLPKDQRESVLASCRYHRDGHAAGTALPPAPAWQQATKLFEADPERNKLGFLFKPVVSDDAVFVAGFGFTSEGGHGQTIQLVRVPLDGGSPSFLGRAPFDGVILESMRRGFEFRWPKEWRSWNLDRYELARDDLSNPPRAACMAEGKYFLATHLGLFAFPTNGDPVQHFGVTNGLPSEDVHSLAYMNGCLFIGAGEVGRAGYLLKFDPRTHQVTTLASSRRKGAASPLDDGPPFYPGFLLADETRGRVLMLAGFNARTPLSGVWSYEPKNGQFKHVAPFTATFPDVHTFWLWSGQPAPGVLAACHLDVSLTLWNTRSDEFMLQHERRKATNSISAIWPVRSKPNGANMQHAPLMLLDGWLWWATPFQRASLETKRVEAFPRLAKDYEFAPAECLQLLSDGKRVLAADRFSVWLLELSSEQSASMKDPTNTP